MNAPPNRSGCVLPKDTLFVPTNLVRPLYRLLEAGVAWHNQSRSAEPLPASMVALLADWADLAGDAPMPVEMVEPVMWLDTATAVAMFAASGVPLSARSITAMAASSQLRAKRHGRRWLYSGDDVVDEIEARVSYRKCSEGDGSRRISDDSESNPSKGHAA